MNLLWISVLCFIASAACQSSSLVLSTVDAQWNFSIAVLGSGGVSFTRNSATYQVLQNLICSIGQYPQYSGSSWTCGTNLALTSDPLGTLATTCNTTGPNGVQNVPTSSGSSFSSCSADADALGLLTTCTSGQIASYGASAAPVCASDSDIAGDAATSCTGGSGGTPKFANSTTYACGLSLTDNDVAQSLLSSCSEGQLARYNGTHWNCDFDYDLLYPSPCANGQTLVANTTSWNCTSDKDALGQLIPACTGNNDTPQYTTSGGWICIPSPVISLSAPIAQTMVTATYAVPSMSFIPSSTGFTGLSGIPWYFTNNTVVKFWSLRSLGATSNVTVTLFAGSSSVRTQVLDSFSYFYEPIATTAVTPGVVGVRLENRGSATANILVDILVELSLA